MVALRKVLVYPGSVAKVDIGRPKSAAAIRAAAGKLALFPQRTPELDDPGLADLATIGVLATIVECTEDKGAGFQLTVNGLRRIRIQEGNEGGEYLTAMIVGVEETEIEKVDADLLTRIRSLYVELDASRAAAHWAKWSDLKTATSDLVAGTMLSQPATAPLRVLTFLAHSLEKELPQFLATEDQGQLADAVADRLPLSHQAKLAVLETIDKGDRLRRLLSLLTQERDNRDFKRELDAQVRDATKERHRSIFLEEQLRVVLRELGEGAPLALYNPIFSGRGFKPDRSLVFVLMPFHDGFRPIYDNVIKPTIESFGLRTVRADDIYGPKAIIEDIWRLLNEAAYVIADLTGKNPNVFYEVGLAHAIGKSVVFLTQSLDDVPFDLRHLRCILYADSVAGTRKLETGLRQTFDAIAPTPVRS